MPKPMRRVRQSDGPYLFSKYAGAMYVEWNVYADTGTEQPMLGTARANGSRLRERSWTWRATDGTEGKTSTRRTAAEALARHAGVAL
jgi:hypothetical protein